MADKRDLTAGKKEIHLSEFWMHCLLAIYLLLAPVICLMF